VRRHRAVNDPNAPEPAPQAPGAGHEATGHLDRDARACALRALPDRQREAVVLRNYMGLSEAQAAEAMGISTGAVGSHLARGMSSVRRLPGPQ
jgi:DNA-directed RNA polymerase specialized sigma24 family protein